MVTANQFILAVGVLLMVSILASRISDRIGVPLLLIFLLIGMLAGEQGLAGIVYDDIFSANIAANLALAVILFDGGLHTPLASFRSGLRPALWLATVGVVVTAAITGYAASHLFGIPILEGFLMGAIIGSTDAAAVFSLLRARGLQLNRRVQATLEIESGSNDPMAAFLTIALIGAIKQGGSAIGWGTAGDFVWQLGVGSVAGVCGGRVLSLLLDRLQLVRSLRPLLAFAGGLSIYAVAAVLGGSGFLAAYVGGLILGNGARNAGGDVRRFHDGLATLAQMGLFLLLGLLVAPSAVLPVMPEALLTALVLILVARPLAVALCLLPFRFDWREKLFISWVGLRGAVPIVLGLYPLLAGVGEGRFAFNVAFVVVLVSLILQGGTIVSVARWLRLKIPAITIGQQLAEIDVPGLRDRELVVYHLPPDSPALGYRIDALILPEAVQMVALVREGLILPRPARVQLAADDYLYLLVPPRELSALEDLFRGVAMSQAEQRFFGPYVLPGTARITDIAALYGVKAPTVAGNKTVDDVFRSVCGSVVAVGDRAALGELEFVARQVHEGRVRKAGLKVRHGTH